MLDLTMALLLAAIACALLGFLGLLGPANAIANDLSFALLALAISAGLVGLMRRVRARHQVGRGDGRVSGSA
jgi:hypothetical protein